MNKKNTIEKIVDKYSSYNEETIVGKILKHSQVKKKILSFKKKFHIELLGNSTENREIYVIKIGKGENNVLLWSQMHGDESTATAAILDLLNFFSDNSFKDYKEKILNKLTLYFIPMLNPDGAERYQRESALNIDINRDAEKLTSPEALILKKIQQKIKPEFAFNLHNQSPLYSVGKSNKQAYISFLAPPYNFKSEINSVRKRAIKIIADLNNFLQNYIPNHVGRYNDEHEPRSFGDSITKWGTSVILIETGGKLNDFKNEFLRKINFLILIKCFSSIASQSFKRRKIDEYYKIPQNDKLFFDLLLRNIEITKNEKKYNLDIGINRKEIITEDANSFYYKGIVADIGDLKKFYGTEELDCTNYKMQQGKIYNKIFKSESDVSAQNVLTLLKKGYTFIKAKNTANRNYTKLPINLITNNFTKKDFIKKNSEANFYLSENNKIKILIINGFLFYLETKTKNIYNSLVY